MIMGDGDNERILILSDDGKYPGRAHKNAFRGVWLQQEGASAAGANAPTAAARMRDAVVSINLRPQT